MARHASLVLLHSQATSRACSVGLRHHRMRTLQASQGKARAGMANSGDLVQLVAQERLVAGRAFDCDLDEVIVLPRREVHLEHFGQVSHSAAESLQDEIVMPIKRHLDQYGFRYAKTRLVEQRGIALDVAFGFKPADALPARTGGESDPVCELGVAQPRVGQKLHDDLPVDSIKLTFRHRTSSKKDLLWVEPSAEANSTAALDARQIRRMRLTENGQSFEDRIGMTAEIRGRDRGLVPHKES